MAVGVVILFELSSTRHDTLPLHTALMSALKYNRYSCRLEEPVFLSGSRQASAFVSGSFACCAEESSFNSGTGGALLDAIRCPFNIIFK